MALIRSLDGRQRIAYVWLFLLRSLGLRKDTLPTLKEPIRILFICHGNLMRSPMAAAWLQKIIDSENRDAGIEIRSAGTFAALGRPADARARDISLSMGVSLEGHTPNQLSAVDVSEADLICVMDFYNETVCVSRFPQARKKIVLLGAFGIQTGELPEILDPVRGNVETVRACYQRIARSVHALWEELSATRTQPS